MQSESKDTTFSFTDPDGYEIFVYRWGPPAGVTAKAVVQVEHGAAEHALRQGLLQYAELMLFFLVVMTYINAMSERQVFLALRSWVGQKSYSYRRIFWMTGLGTFLLSPFLDNLSTALLMGAVILNLERENKKFIAMACTNIVVASNAGGAFSPDMAAY